LPQIALKVIGVSREGELTQSAKPENIAPKDRYKAAQTGLLSPEIKFNIL
jgi:hypothetical protein